MQRGQTYDENDDGIGNDDDDNGNGNDDNDDGSDSWNKGSNDDNDSSNDSCNNNNDIDIETVQAAKWKEVPQVDRGDNFDKIFAAACQEIVATLKLSSSSLKAHPRSKKI